MRCNCENSTCLACYGKGCAATAGAKRAMYIGAICDPCADNMPAEYLIPSTYQRAFDVYLEDEIPLRGDIFLLDVEMGYELLGPWDEEGERYPLCNPIFVFKLYGYNELVQNYEIDITDSLTAEENFELQKDIYELASDQAASAAEARYDRD